MGIVDAKMNKRKIELYFSSESEAEERIKLIKNLFRLWIWQLVVAVLIPIVLVLLKVPYSHFMHNLSPYIYENIIIHIFIFSLSLYLIKKRTLLFEKINLIENHVPNHKPLDLFLYFWRYSYISNYLIIAIGTFLSVFFKSINYYFLFVVELIIFSTMSLPDRVGILEKRIVIKSPQVTKDLFNIDL